MKIKVIGKQNRQGTSKKTNKPYNFNVVHYVGKSAFVTGDAALTLNLDPANYPLDSIIIGADYIVDFDGNGYVVDFHKA